MSNTTKEFICPCLSLKKEIIDNNQKLIYENVFLHILPYLVADKKNLKKYHTLVSYDIQYTLLPEDNPSMQIKFISSVIQNKKNLKRVNQEYKDTYSIFYTEYKYYKKNIYKNMAYNVSYADLDEYIKKHYTQIMIVYFIVQNLIRLANHEKLYSIANAKDLAVISFIDDENKELYKNRAVTTAWNNLHDNALIIFGFVQNLLDKHGWADTFKIQKFLAQDHYNKINECLYSDELQSAFKDYESYEDDVKNILSYSLFASETIGDKKHLQAKDYYDGTVLSPKMITKLELSKKEIDFLPISNEERTFILDSKKI